MVSGGWPSAWTGTWTVYSTVSIQKVDSITTACALGEVAFASPSRKAMLPVPPPNSGGAGTVETVIAVLEVTLRPVRWVLSRLTGLFSIAWVIVPALMNGVRSCGIRAVPPAAAVWLGNGLPELGAEPVAKGLMGTTGNVGLPLAVTA